MATRTIKIDDEIHALIKRNKRPSEKMGDTLKRLLKEAKEQGYNEGLDEAALAEEVHGQD